MSVSKAEKIARSTHEGQFKRDGVTPLDTDNEQRDLGIDKAVADSLVVIAESIAMICGPETVTANLGSIASALLAVADSNKHAANYC